MTARRPATPPETGGAAGGDGDGSAVQEHGGLTDRLDDDAVIVGTKPGTARPHILALEIDAVTCIATEQVQPPRRHAYAGALARVGTPKLDGFRLCDDGGSLPENLGRAL
jgi:hypothetical protein